MTAGGRAVTEPWIRGIPAALWQVVASAPHRLLMLDYDGTLAPFHVRREAALPLPRSLHMLRAVATSERTSVAIVSGRPVDELDRMVGTLPVWLVGGHGWEVRPPGGDAVRHPVSAEARAALERAREAAVRRGWEPRIEIKHASLVLHTRGLQAETALGMERECEALWSGAAPAAVRCVRFNGGVELVARGRDKGTAVRDLMARSPLGALPVYLGDDITDEDAFDTVSSGGFGIRVGPQERPSLALGRLASLESVPHFLETWLLMVDGTKVPEAT